MPTSYTQTLSIVKTLLLINKRGKNHLPKECILTIGNILIDPYKKHVQRLTDILRVFQVQLKSYSTTEDHFKLNYRNAFNKHIKRLKIPISTIGKKDA